MGAHRAIVSVFRLVVPCLVVGPLVLGCQVSGVPSKAVMVEHREKVDDTGLAAPSAVEALKACASLPMGWQALRLQKAALYTHQQWRAPSRRTAVGVTYVRMPLPLSTKSLVWIAMGEVNKRVQDGKILRRWTDTLGREWFEAENAKYHMTGYVMTRGFDAWINYCGHRTTEAADEAEVALATRALDTILPLSAVQKGEARADASEKKVETTR